MRGHLRLHASSAETSDEHVLRAYPTTIRRRILRHLYLRALSNCWLFRGLRPKFLDALLAVAKVELLMPQVLVFLVGGREGWGHGWGAVADRVHRVRTVHLFAHGLIKLAECAAGVVVCGQFQPGEQLLLGVGLATSR